ncbi:MAG: CpXC domain-containing protein [Lachnospiraceae bacterium]|nr:CpXC domain-containing protein [Lachnospiraceae bacterium]
MSLHDEVKVRCKKCGGETTAECWTSLDSNIDTDGRDRLLNGTLFTVACNKCGNEMNLCYPILYNDMKHRAMVWLVTKKEEIEKTALYFKESKVKIGKENQKISEDYRQRIVTDQNHLREKAIIFDNGLDDRIIELAKFAFAGMALGKCPGDKIADIFFAKNGDGFRFEIYTQKGNAMTGEFSKKMYDDFLSLYMKSGRSLSVNNEYIIDQAWAADIFKDFGIK